MCYSIAVSIANTTVSVTGYTVLMNDYGEYEVLREKLVPVPYCPPQIPDWPWKELGHPYQGPQKPNHSHC